MNKNKLDTGFKIRSLRQRQMKGQNAIAQNLGISIAAYAKIEKGITDINISRLTQIAALFNVKPEILLPSYIEEEKVIESSVGNIENIEKINALNSEVIKLQSELINAYEQIENLKLENSRHRSTRSQSKK
ncbi:hypothetical protein PBAL39_22460 [Pedobacter sp. BAL39]|uniref:helix-turn-helix domain-containing protein n=1 Tax=Pedobacter sp. BAL39 TaxID=391596 RepID=UPI00015596B9|nr:helix-turn-helix transcriptional regulator [Pedobacter sp. BAL39]EDM38883.1 hypothetical protein PBAL39_22460 [Pedobacter sp. BAL39]